jgi:ornithine cyclodeaminase/alanine dehydrogenase-like protein (mu-crystallin family)
MDETGLIYLSEKDLIESGCFDVDLCIYETIEALKEYNRGNVIYPDKVVQIFNSETQARLNTLPATLCYKGISGLKSVAVFPENPVKFQIPNLSALIILHSMENGLPFAVMDGKMISSMRTGAVGSVAAKYLSKENPQTVGIIGAGEQARYHVFNLMRVHPTISEIRVYSRHKESRQKFVDSMSHWLSNVRFVPVEGAKEAITDADIIITATSSQGPFLKSEWIKNSAFYSHVGGYEDEYAVVKNADAIIADNWEMTKHRTQTISRMYKEGLIADKDIYADLDEIVIGSKDIREDNPQFIYFNAVGLSYIDLAIAYAMYNRAIRHGKGIKLPLSISSPFDKL